MEKKGKEGLNLSRGNSIRGKTSILSRALNYSADVIMRLSFFYGFERAINLIQALKKPPMYKSIRINTIKSDPKKVQEALHKIEGIEVTSSKLEEALLIKIQGPFEVSKTEKTIVAKDKSSEKVMLGSNLYRPGIKQIKSKIAKGDKVNIETQFGETIAYGTSMISSRDKESMPSLTVRVEESKYQLVNLHNLEVFQRGWAYPAPLLSTQAIKWLDPLSETILCIFPDYRDLVQIITTSNGNAEIAVITESKTEEDMIQKGLRNINMGDWITKLKWSKKKRLPYLTKKSFDAALFSPKSSKIGIRPRISGYLKESDIIRLKREARRNIEQTLPLLKNDGRMLYLVPSLDPGEGEENIQYLINEFGLEAFARQRTVGHPGVDGYPLSNRVLRSYPDKDEDEGWFASLLFK